MEKQINDYQIRWIGVQRMDTDLNKYKQEIDDLYKQSEMDKRRLCELCEKNAKLELDMKNMLNQNVNLDEELNYYKQKFTFLSAELSKQQQALTNQQQMSQAQINQLAESNKLKTNEMELMFKDLNKQMQEREQELSRFKEYSRSKDISLEECSSRIKLLSEQLSLEQEAKLKSERQLDLHKNEIHELKLKIDECQNEAKKLVSPSFA